MVTLDVPLAGVPYTRMLYLPAGTLFIEYEPVVPDTLPSLVIAAPSQDGPPDMYMVWTGDTKILKLFEPDGMLTPFRLLL